MSRRTIETDLPGTAADRAKELWWLMHHSYNPNNQTFALTAYFDDSGSDDLNPMTTIGGPVMSMAAFVEFSSRWDELLRRYRIPQPFKFARSSGLYPEMKLAFFAEASKIINEQKLYSISISVAAADFDASMSRDVRRAVIGPYGIAFFSAVLTNQQFSNESLTHPAERIAYVVDAGFPFAEQLVETHRLILKIKRDSGKACFVGSLTFDSDDRVPALQAADMIAGAARRKQLGSLTGELAPLATLLADRSRHTHIALPKGAIEMFAGPINKWMSTGVIPSLASILR